MATATDMFTGLEDQVLETVKQGQEAVVKAVRTWADASKNLIPDLPPLPFADQLPEHLRDRRERLCVRRQAPRLAA